MTYRIELKVWDAATRQLEWKPVRPSGASSKPYEWTTEDEAYRAARNLYHLSVQGVDYQITKVSEASL